jgi:NADH-quinone oxidoreductase subunit A
MGQYLPFVVLMGLAIAFGGLSFVASRLLAPRRPSSAKQAPYECGIVPSREPPDRFPVTFYVVAMLFIMFDIEIIFIYPYAVERGALGAFDWGPLHQYRSLERDAAMVSAERDSSSTIRRVGLEGRLDRVTAGGADTQPDDDVAA